MEDDNATVPAVPGNDSSGAFFLGNSPFLVPVNGFASPFLVLVTLVTNCLVCAVLLRPNMRNPTNAILVAIATSDLLTGIWPVPCYVYFFTLENYRDWVPYRWCFAYHCLIDYLPTIFHTASIWLTVALAVQRYIFVCHAIRARELCTIRNFVRVIIAIYLAAILSQVCRFVEIEYQPVWLPSKIDPSRTVEACRHQFVPWVTIHANVYFNVYYWFRVIFIHLLSCASLVLLNALLVNAMRCAQHRRQQLLKQNRRSESRRLAESNCTTLMLVAVVGVFLLVEFPLAILLIILIMQNTFDLILISTGSTQIATLFINLFILLSYPLNFFIYCGMSRQFRATFKGMFLSGLKPTGNGRDADYVSLTTERLNMVETKM